MLKVTNIQQQTPNFKGMTIGPRAQGVLDSIGAMKSPAQRAAFGVAALVMQPVIDRFNPWVDKDTRKKSAIRSAAKAIACSVTGIAIREAGILGTNAILTSKTISSKLPEFVTKDKNHSSAVIGTLIGLGIMMFTNFLIDVPLTDKLTSCFMKKADKKESAKKQGGIQAPSPQIKETSFAQQNKEIIQTISNKINSGELPPMSQVNMEVINGLN